MPGSATWATWTTHPDASHCQHSSQWRRRLFRRQNSSGGRLPYIHLSVLPLQHLLPLAPPQAATPPMPAPHPGLEQTGIVCLWGVRWPSTPQGQPLLHTIGCPALHNLGTSSSAHRQGHGMNWRWWDKESLLQGGFVSQCSPAGKKGSSEFQELRADKHPGHVQGKEPQAAQR